MRHAPVLMTGLLIATALSGCIGDGDDETDETLDPAGMGSAAAVAVPEPIEDEQTVAASADVLSSTPVAGLCGMPTAECFTYPFELTNTTRIDATITWDVPLNDFDIYVIQDGEIAVDGATPPPATSESISSELDAGSYEILVTGYLVVQGTFALNATFQPA